MKFLNLNKYVFILNVIFYVFIINTTNASSSEDSLKKIQYIDSVIKYHKFFPFIKYDINFIEWVNNEAINSFFTKLSQADKKKIKILHIGDSHVQAGIGTGRLRDRFQKHFGYGGRGLVFPFRAANTHSAWNYRTYAEGIWENSKNVDKDNKFDIGISGVTIYTNDSSANFKLVFPKNDLHKDFNVLKLFLRISPNSFDLKLKTSSQIDTLFIDCNSQTNNNYIEVKINEISDTLHFFVDKTKPEQNFFEFYGLIIESQFDNGILYSSAGINGAGYASILKQNLFVEQIDTYKPDMVVIDLGGNDFYKQAFNYSSMEKMLMTIINKIRTASPNSLIIINSSQNFYRRNYNVAECKNFSELTRNVAFKNNCVFYDYYRVSGGDKAMLKWLGAKLAKRDKVHLTNEGYHLKADLFMNAILNSYKIWLNNQYLDSLLAFNFALDSADLVHCFPKNDFRKNTVSKVVADKKENKSHFQKITNTGSAVEYTIKKGDNLGSIAEKFDVSVSNLKSWNNLSSNKIIAGKKLIVYSDVKNTPPSTQTNNNSKQIKHKVKSGESLWIIARKYNTTVDNIKKLNNLKNDNLKPGIVLIIK